MFCVVLYIFLSNNLQRYEKSCTFANYFAIILIFHLKDYKIYVKRNGNEPFGAVLVKNGEIVFTNENQIYTRHDPTFHGEAGLIREFCAKTSITDLHDYTLYSSCEPCFMCSGAMVWVKLGRLVYGASNSDLEAILGNEGCNCSKIVFDNSFWQPQVTAGILRDESLMILKDYFDTHAKG